VGQTKKCARCKKDRMIDREIGICASCDAAVKARLKDPKAPWNRPAVATGKGNS
jgi:hypothetical protein